MRYNIDVIIKIKFNINIPALLLGVYKYTSIHLY